MDWNTWRLVIFVVGLGLFTLLGYLYPRRKLEKGWVYLSVTNVVFGAVNPLLVRLILSLGLLQWTAMVAESGRGLINMWQLPVVVSSLLVVVLLDFIIYWQHRLFHTLPFLWRLHRVHHTDTHFDSSTALRFHFIEILFSYLIKFASIWLLGGPVIGVFLFEVILNFSAMFNHSNWAFPLGLDKMFRKVIVTPDFHRVHHSPIVEETNSNYGFFLSVWDYLFGTYRDQPAEGHEQMEIGLEVYRSRKDQNFFALWIQPFLPKRKA